MVHSNFGLLKQYREPNQNHICSIYRNKDEQFSLIIPYILQGLDRDEKCIYIVDENTRAEVLDEFKKRIGKERHSDLDNLIFMTKAEAYLKDGYFDPERMIDLLKESERIALKEGHSGMRFTGEMTWVFTKLPGVEKLFEYEAKLNYFFPGSKSKAICQYNENKFAPELLIDVIYTHPVVGLYGYLFENPHYMSPEIFLARKSGDVSRTTYENLRDDILRSAGI